MCYPGGSLLTTQTIGSHVKLQIFRRTKVRQQRREIWHVSDLRINLASILPEFDVSWQNLLNSLNPRISAIQSFSGVLLFANPATHRPLHRDSGNTHLVPCSDSLCLLLRLFRCLFALYLSEKFPRGTTGHALGE